MDTTPRAIRRRPVSNRIIGFTANDPDELVEQLAPVANGVLVTPTKRSKFKANVRLSRLPRLGIFTVDCSSFRVRAEPNDYDSISAPVTGTMSAVEGRSVDTFTLGSAYGLNSGESIDWRLSEGAQVLVARFDRSLLADCANKLNGREEIQSFNLLNRLSLTTNNGSDFWRYLNFVWNEVGRGATWLDSEMIVREVEDTLLMLSVRAAGTEFCIQDNIEKKSSSLNGVRKAEDYFMENLSEPVSLAEVAKVAKVNARTLSRNFKKIHGVSPMVFLRMRRLEAAHKELLCADPYSTTITSIAMRYGFHNLGRFSDYYRKLFDELPSETLNK